MGGGLYEFGTVVILIAAIALRRISQQALKRFLELDRWENAVRGRRRALPQFTGTGGVCFKIEGVLI